MILDSGNRREFETGAVRDIQEGKGRCDLLPLDVISRIYKDDMVYGNEVSILMRDINRYIRLGDLWYLENAIKNAIHMLFQGDVNYAMLELSKHFEEGAKKYGERNWEKGIPTHCYVDSALRHLFKHLGVQKDERHDIACLWNLMCCMWTCLNKQEMDDYRKDDKVNET